MPADPTEIARRLRSVAHARSTLGMVPTDLYDAAADLIDRLAAENDSLGWAHAKAEDHVDRLELDLDDALAESKHLTVERNEARADNARLTVRAETAEAERDAARAECERLREALREIIDPAPCGGHSARFCEAHDYRYPCPMAEAQAAAAALSTEGAPEAPPDGAFIGATEAEANAIAYLATLDPEGVHRAAAGGAPEAAPEHHGHEGLIGVKPGCPACERDRRKAEAELEEKTRCRGCGTSNGACAVGIAFGLGGCCGDCRHSDSRAAWGAPEPDPADEGPRRVALLTPAGLAAAIRTVSDAPMEPRLLPARPPTPDEIAAARVADLAELNRVEHAADETGGDWPQDAGDQ